MNTNLTPAEILALSKAVTDKEALAGARKALAVGVHEVDVTVRVRGVVKVARDTETTNYEVDAWSLLAAALNKLRKATDENVSLADLVACAGKFKDETVEKLKKAANDQIKLSAKAVKVPRSGSVSPTLIVETVAPRSEG